MHGGANGQRPHHYNYSLRTGKRMMTFAFPRVCVSRSYSSTIFGLLHRLVLPRREWHDENARQTNSEHRSSNRLMNNLMVAPAPFGYHVTMRMVLIELSRITLPSV